MNIKNLLILLASCGFACSGKHLAKDEFNLLIDGKKYLFTSPKLLNNPWCAPLVFDDHAQADEQKTASFSKHRQFLCRNRGCSSLVNNPQALKRIRTCKKDDFCQGQLQKRALSTNSKIDFQYCFHDRQSDVLVVIAPGFGQSQHLLTPFLSILPQYDVVTFDFRGQGFVNNKPNPGSTTWANLWKKWLGLKIDVEQTALGAKEHEEIIDLVNHLKTKKSYQKIIGIGLCFGACMMVKAQVTQEQQAKHLFDKLILDACWPDFVKLTEKFLHHPGLFITPQRRPELTTWVDSACQFAPIRGTLRFFCRQVLFKYYKEAEAFDCLAYLKKLQAPVLFFHGQADRLVYADEFKQIFDSVHHKNKIAIITSERHLMHMLNCQNLMETIIGEFITCVNAQQVADYLLKNKEVSYEQVVWANDQ